jgi:hypothetical protein
MTGALAMKGQTQPSKIPGLVDVNLQERVGMLMTPSPIVLLIFCLELLEVYVFAVIFLGPHPVRFVFMAIPLMVVIVAFVMVFVIFRPELSWRERHWNDKRGSHKGRRKNGFHHSPVRSRFVAADRPTTCRFVQIGTPMRCEPAWLMAEHSHIGLEIREAKANLQQQEPEL